MKIPDNKIVHNLDDRFKLWKHTAHKYSMEYGVFIDVEIWYRDNTTSVTEVNFIVEDHKFSSLKELRKALKNKSFL